MTTNRDWLFSKPWEEQLAWLDAEHVAVSTKPLKMPTDGEWAAVVGAPKLQNSQSDAPKSEETDEIGTSKCDIRDFDAEHAEGRFTDFSRTSASPRQDDGMDSRERSGRTVFVDGVQVFPPKVLEHMADSREKLLEDANALAIDYWGRKRTWGEANDLKRDVIALLDRQAAITEQECIDQHIADQIGSIWKDEKVRKLQAKVDELTAERDQLTNAINELQKKQPYCYNPEQPLDTLNTIGRYIDEQKSQIRNLVKDLVRVSDERNNLEVNNLQLHTLAGEQAATIDELQASLDSTKRAIAKAGGTWTENEDSSVAVVFAPDVGKLRAERNQLKEQHGRQAKTIGRLQERNGELQELVDDLEDERDKLREELRIEREAVEACEGCGKVDSLTAELDYWRAKCGELLDIAHEMERVGCA